MSSSVCVGCFARHDRDTVLECLKKLREIGLMLTSDVSILTSSWKTSDVTFALSFSNCSIKCGTTSSGFPFLTTSPLENTLVYNYVEFVHITCQSHN